MSATETRFESNFDLSRLPYFELADGALALADDSLGPIVDVHTHLALSYGGKPNVDLWRRHSRTEHYLPVERAIDLGLYANRNFSDRDLSRMKRDLTLGSLTAGGMRDTHTAPQIIGEMDRLGIAVSVLLPIDLPVLSYNAEAYLSAVGRSEGRLLSFGSVHPWARGVRERLERQRAAGARGVKLHPNAQAIAPDHPRAMRLYHHCGELGLPVLWHCGPVGIEPALGRYLCQLKHYWRAVHEHPQTTFILGHSGALQWTMALELAQQYQNVYLEIASQSLGAVQQLVRDAPSERLMFGTDWPFYHQGLALAKLLLATEGQPAARRRILWDNAAELLDLTEP